MIDQQKIIDHAKKLFGENFVFRNGQLEVLTDIDPYPFPVGAFRNVNVINN